MEFDNDFNPVPKQGFSSKRIASMLIAAVVGSGTTLLLAPTLLKANVSRLSVETVS